MLAWLWRSRLTWRAAVPLTAVLGLTVGAATGIDGRLGVVALAVGLTVWSILVSRLFDNEARHVAALARAKGRTPPARSVRRLLMPWWARTTLIVGVFAATVAAGLAFDGDGLVVLTLALALLAAWLVERAVIAVRS